MKETKFCSVDSRPVGSGGMSSADRQDGERAANGATWRRKPLIVAGPCSAETCRQTLETCRALAATGRVHVLRAGVWKPRTQPGRFEGVGAEALAWMIRAREETGLPVAVEVATATHAKQALAAGIDMVWLGARTTVSPFSVQEVADALRGSAIGGVMVKNPVSPDPDLWAGAVERLLGAGIAPERLILVHRGFAEYGRDRYRNAPVWALALEMRRRFPGMTLLCDPSHLAGKREFVREVAQTAADLCYDGLMIESHIRPVEALSDAAQQLTPDELDRMLAALRWRTPQGDDPEYVRELGRCRSEIDLIDARLLCLLARRMEVSDEIGRLKLRSDVAILQEERWREVLAGATDRAAGLGLDGAFVRNVFEAIHNESIVRQRRIMGDADATSEP